MMSSPKRLKTEFDSAEPGEQQWFEFEKTLGLGIGRSGSSSGNFDKICLISYYCVRDDDDNDDDTIGYCLYCIDINSPPIDNPQTLQPILYWDLDYRYDTFAVLGSHLYMFGENRKFEPRPQRPYNNVFIYNKGQALSSPSTRPTYMNIRASPSTGPRMKGCKICPVAVALGDSKICVFGSALNLLNHSFPPSFEMLDTKKPRWTSLPEPPINLHRHCHIQSYSVRGSCLIIQIIQQGIYGINVDYDPPKWVKLDLSDNISNFSISGNWTMVGKTLCSPFLAKTRGGEGVHNISFKGPIGRESLIRCNQQGVLHSDDLDLCIVRAGFDSYFSLVPNLLVDIVKLDHEALATLGSDSSEWKNIQSNKSFTFELTSRPCAFLGLIGCFPIKVALEPPALSNQPFVGSHKVGFQNQADWNLGNFVNTKNTGKKCSYCGYNNHTVETCFKIHGFPPRYKEDLPWDVTQNPASPFYLHPFDQNPSLVLVTEPLTSHNYFSWHRSMKVSLLAKNKYCFVDGSLPLAAIPEQNNTLAWHQCNQMVLSWIEHSLSPSIAQSVIWFETAEKVWKNLKEQFSQGGGLHIAELHDELFSTTQGDLSVTDYYTKLKIAWEEFVDFREIPACKSCIKKVHAYQDEDFIFKFLRGLNANFGIIKSQILMMDPLPVIDHVLNLVIQHERQLQGIQMQHFDGEPVVNYTMCSFCHREGHTVDQCFFSGMKRR